MEVKSQQKSGGDRDGRPTKSKRVSSSARIGKDRNNKSDGDEDSRLSGGSGHDKRRHRTRSKDGKNIRRSRSKPSMKSSTSRRISGADGGGKSGSGVKRSERSSVVSNGQRMSFYSGGGNSREASSLDQAIDLDLTAYSMDSRPRKSSSSTNRVKRSSSWNGKKSKRRDRSTPRKNERNTALSSKTPGRSRSFETKCSKQREKSASNPNNESPRNKTSSSTTNPIDEASDRRGDSGSDSNSHRETDRASNIENDDKWDSDSDSVSLSDSDSDFSAGEYDAKDLVSDIDDDKQDDCPFEDIPMVLDNGKKYLRPASFNYKGGERGVDRQLSKDSVLGSYLDATSESNKQIELSESKVEEPDKDTTKRSNQTRHGSSHQQNSDRQFARRQSSDKSRSRSPSALSRTSGSINLYRERDAMINNKHTRREKRNSTSHTSSTQSLGGTEALGKIKRTSYSNTSSSQSLSGTEELRKLKRDSCTNTSSRQSLDKRKERDKSGRNDYSRSSSRHATDKRKELDRSGQSTYSISSSSPSIDKRKELDRSGRSSYSNTSSKHSLDKRKDLDKSGRSTYSNFSSTQSLDLISELGKTRRTSYSNTSSRQSFDRSERSSQQDASSRQSLDLIKELDKPKRSSNSKISSSQSVNGMTELDNLKGSTNSNTSSEQSFCGTMELTGVARSSSKEKKTVSRSVARRRSSGSIDLLPLKSKRSSDIGKKTSRTREKPKRSQSDFAMSPVDGGKGLVKLTASTAKEETNNRRISRTRSSGSLDLQSTGKLDTGKRRSRSGDKPNRRTSNRISRTGSFERRRNTGSRNRNRRSLAETDQTTSNNRSSADIEEFLNNMKEAREKQESSPQDTDESRKNGSTKDKTKNKKIVKKDKKMRPKSTRSDHKSRRSSREKETRRKKTAVTEANPSGLGKENDSDSKVNNSSTTSTVPSSAEEFLSGSEKNIDEDSNGEPQKPLSISDFISYTGEIGKQETNDDLHTLAPPSLSSNAKRKNKTELVQLAFVDGESPKVNKLVALVDDGADSIPVVQSTAGGKTVAKREKRKNTDSSDSDESNAYEYEHEPEEIDASAQVPSVNNDDKGNFHFEGLQDFVGSTEKKKRHGMLRKMRSSLTEGSRMSVHRARASITETSKMTMQKLMGRGKEEAMVLLRNSCDDSDSDLFDQEEF
mmetsp:Transcript_1447/g.3535  ORF Transcript_1447/g.3535 Transcript_1447/m.3535 type:complete len:1168 (+) Transcript_1447:27-3530(+)